MAILPDSAGPEAYNLSRPAQSDANNNGAELHIEKCYKKNDTGRWIEDRGFVKRLVSDDNDGSRHQRFILAMPNRQSLLIAHNIDLAQRVPLGLSDRLQFRGMYEWNELGGLVHWTHDDPHGIEDGGWIRYRRKTYS